MAHAERRACAVQYLFERGRAALRRAEKLQWWSRAFVHMLPEVRRQLKLRRASEAAKFMALHAKTFRRSMEQVESFSDKLLVAPQDAPGRTQTPAARLAEEQGILDGLTDTMQSLGSGYRIIMDERADALNAVREEALEQAIDRDVAEVPAAVHCRKLGQTPALQPLLALFHAIAAPLRHVACQLEELGGSNSAYALRMLQCLNLTEAGLRRAHNQKDLRSFFHTVTKMLQPIASSSQMHNFHEWGVSASATSSQRWIAILTTMIGADTSALPGTLISLCVADNTGTLVQGAIQALRKEITSVYFKDLSAYDIERTLGLSVHDYLRLSTDWVPMHLTGIESPLQLLAGVEEDGYDGFLRQTFMRACDDIHSLNYLEALDTRDTSDDYLESGEAVDGRAGSLPNERQYKTVSEMGFYVEGTTEVTRRVLKPEEKRWVDGVRLVENTETDGNDDDADDGGDESDDPLNPRRIWSMVTSYPSIDMNHADIKAIAFLLALASRRADLASALTAMLGDGAPTLKIAAFQRAELCRLMKEVPADDVAAALQASGSCTRFRPRRK